MTQTIKLRKNKLNIRRRMKGGDGMEQGMKVFITGLQVVASNPLCRPALEAAKTTLLSTFMGAIPDEPITNDFIKGLGIEATLKELIETSLRTITCKDIGITATVLPKLLAFEKIQEILKADNEAGKKATEYYTTLHDIITNKDNQELVCRVLNNLKSKNYITDDHIKVFITFIGGDPKICKGLLSRISEGAKNLLSKLSGTKTDDSAVNTNDKRCGEDLIVKKTFFSGEYCAPKPAPNVVEAAKPEQAPQSSEAQVITPETPEQLRPTEKVTGGNRRKYNRANKSKKNKKSKSKKSKRAKNKNIVKLYEILDK